MRAICAAAAALLCGCWNSGFDWRVEGTVRDVRSRTAIQGAFAKISCDGVAFAGFDSSDAEAQDVSAGSDASGHFGLSSLGDGPHLGCTLRVYAAGYQTWSGSLAQLCQTQANGRCKRALVEVALSP